MAPLGAKWLHGPGRTFFYVLGRENQGATPISLEYPKVIFYTIKILENIDKQNEYIDNKFI